MKPRPPVFDEGDVGEPMCLSPSRQKLGRAVNRRADDNHAIHPTYLRDEDDVDLGYAIYDALAATTPARWSR